MTRDFIPILAFGCALFFANTWGCGTSCPSGTSLEAGRCKPTTSDAGKTQIGAVTSDGRAVGNDGIMNISTVAGRGGGEAPSPASPIGGRDAGSAPASGPGPADAGRPRTGAAGTESGAGGSANSSEAGAAAQSPMSMEPVPSTSACVADAMCVPSGDTCRLGRTACVSGRSDCVASTDAPDGTVCPDGTCSVGHCCPRGQSWTTTSGCQVVCTAEQRRCGTTCVASSEPCNGACSAGEILCNGKCLLGDCCSNSACGRCKKCVNNRCTNQDAHEDLEDECYEGPCGTGTCNGNGDCGYLPRGTVYCEVTRLISCGGGEDYVDEQCPHNCGPSCKPTDPSCKGPATCNECQPGLGFHKCASSTSVSECGSDGRWRPGVACPSGQTCQGDEYTARCSSP